MPKPQKNRSANVPTSSLLDTMLSNQAQAAVTSAVQDVQDMWARNEAQLFRKPELRAPNPAWDNQNARSIAKGYGTRKILHGDRRVFHPSDIFRPAHAFKREATRLVIGNTPTSIRFADPDLVTLCIRRKVRREVLHALRRTGLGSKKRHRRRNHHTIISCK